MFCSPKVTQTSGPTVLFFKVCHWAASVYRFFLNLSLITLTAKRSFYHPWCVKIKISGTSDRCKIWCNFISYWIHTFGFSSLNIFPLAALKGIMLYTLLLRFKKIYIVRVDMFSGNVKMTTLSRSCPAELGQHLKKKKVWKVSRACIFSSCLFWVTLAICVWYVCPM